MLECLLLLDRSQLVINRKKCVTNVQYSLPTLLCSITEYVLTLGNDLHRFYALRNRQ